MTPTQLAYRGYNLMMAAFLFFIGIGMGTDAIPEGDVPDKIDDLLLLAIGLIAVGWYLTWSRNRRSLVPVVLTVVALAAQVLGVVLEADDPASIGDNIGGMVMLVPLVVFATWQYVRTARIIGAEVPVPVGSMGSDEP